MRRRYYRTVILGVAALATLIWTAVEQFGIPWTEIGSFFFAVVIGIIGVILAAALTVGLWQGLKILLHRDK